MKELIKIRDLSVSFYTYEGTVRALNDLNLDIYQGETLGLVGETGCGKTMTSLSILRLIMPPGRIDSGSIHFYGLDGTPVDLLSLKESRMRAIRGSEISMVFQEPGAALNPVYTIGDQITEVILLHRRQELARNALVSLDEVLTGKGSFNSLLKPFRLVQKKLMAKISENKRALAPRIVGAIPLVRRLLWRLDDEALKIAVSLLKEVEIADPARVVRQHPHQLSGGMKQRTVIAMALACCTRLLMADEPTTALDVTIQAQILELLRKLKQELNSSILYITHDLAVAAEMCDRVGVMYSGTLCEIAEVEDIYVDPLHPYTKALLMAVPKPGQQLSAIGGFVPDPLDLPPGCRFHPRCKDAMEICMREIPGLTEVKPGHMVACHLYSGGSVGNSD
jgi:peptide/nickel transport system ATP-binding protein